MPEAWRADLFRLIGETPHLDWLLLTKRVGNVLKMLDGPGMPSEGLPANVWLGATVVNQQEYDRDANKLLSVKASVRFLSMGPLLGHIHGGSSIGSFDWVIVGGESGADARPIQREWVDSLHAQCERYDVPFFFKQWGGVTASAGGCEFRGAEVKQWPLAA